MNYIYINHAQEDVKASSDVLWHNSLSDMRENSRADNICSYSRFVIRAGHGTDEPAWKSLYFERVMNDDGGTAIQQMRMVLLCEDGIIITHPLV